MSYIVGPLPPPTPPHPPVIVVVTQLLPEVTHGWLIQEVTPEVIHTAKQAGFQMVCPRANALTPEGVRALNQEGFRVRAWGVKTIEVRGCCYNTLVGWQHSLSRRPFACKATHSHRNLLCAVCLCSPMQLLHHVVKCGVDGATVNWPQQAADALRE